MNVITPVKGAVWRGTGDTLFSSNASRVIRAYGVPE